jgi:hypothetical protein
MYFCFHTGTNDPTEHTNFGVESVSDYLASDNKAGTADQEEAAQAEQSVAAENNNGKSED